MTTVTRRLLACLWMLSLSLFTVTSFGAERVTYYHLDLLGSPVAATDHTGAVVWRESYKPYGQRMLKDDGGSNKLWYTGKAHEEGIQLSYYGARWYHPQLGRFLAVDPVDFQEGNVQSFNRYAYANNNPYRYIDPDGRAPWDRNQKGINNPFGLDAGFGPGRGPGGKLDVGAGRVNDNKSFSQITNEQNSALASEITKGLPKPGVSGGQGAGKGFTDKIKDQARKESEGTCVFCGTKTTSEPGPTRSEIDHAIPKSRGGNNSLENAQNTCRTCNRQKGAKTTEEFSR